MNINSVLLYESGNEENLYPFSVLHCSWEIRCGAFRIFEKVQKLFPDSRIIYNGREKHVASFLERFDHSDQSLIKENVLVIHPAVLPTTMMKNEMIAAYDAFRTENNEDKTVVFCFNSVPFAAFIPANELLNPTDFDKSFLPKFLTEYSATLPHLDISEPKIINYLWDCLDFNSYAIKDDFEYFSDFTYFEELTSNAVHIINKSHVKIGVNCDISPTVVLDARQGPIIIGNNVKILPQSTIIGPCFIGDNTIIKIGAKIYEHTSIGEHCKIGGEVENSIIHAFSNKQHDGFLGHSYISEWVNLGADTNTSDLKNTYANIKVDLRSRRMNTYRMFLGLLCGDHTKTAIATRFTTGTVVGISSILFNDGFLPRSIPSFTWGGNANSTKYQIDKVIDTVKTVMKRRNKTLSEAEETLIIEEFNRG
jgi:UDP-N-acetylglucosamine diphosphorylase/glucosamine-1-phosphate N-acetyltransferase